ncbi:MAG: ComEC/Rec2 family competence protein [Chloroflexi bacterium]|nr:ComEC/Rec2 family competence protein [Chloroflexota bacterium]
MPRAGWLAAGAVAAAVVAPSLGASGPIPPAAAALILIVVCLIASRRKPRTGTGRHVASVAVLAGVVLILVRVALGAWLAPPSATVPPPTDERAWRAEVLSVGSTADGQQRAHLQVRDDMGGTWRIYGWLPRYPPVVPTHRLGFTARLEPSPVDEGFGAFLARSGAVATVRIRSFEVLPAEGPLALLEAIRRAAGDAIARVIPAPQAGLAAGILVGLRDQVDRTLAADFATAGLSHVVAISGWNIALVGAVVMALLRRARRSRRTAVVLIAIVAYTLLAGASPSVVRAAVMGGICLVARESGRRGAAPTALGLAAVGMLLLDPRIVDDVGFELSVAATAGLIAWSTPISERLRRHVPARTPGWLVETLGVSLAAQAATLPIILLQFGRLSLISPIANLVVAPLVAPVMLASLVGLLCGTVIALGGPFLVVAPLIVVASLLLGAMIAVGQMAAAVPLASIEIPADPARVTAVAAAGIMSLIGTARGRALVSRFRSAQRRDGRSLVPIGGADVRRTGSSSGRHGKRAPLLAIGVGSALVVVAASLALARPDGRLRITVLDVGQGDAVLIEGARGGRILVDGGPDPDRLAVLLDERIPAFDRRLDVVVLTHPHEDHVAGIALLLERYRVGVVAEPGMLGAGPGDRAFRSAVARLGVRHVTLAAPDVLELDGTSMRVLWPRQGEVPRTPPDTGTAVNNVSIVLDVRAGERRLLLTGDVEEEIDPRLLAEGLASGGRVDVLKVAHHGSRTASTDPLLDAIRPRVALVSAGRDNPYGHPAPETIERLEAAGTRVLRTDLDGSLEISTDGRDLLVATSGGRTAVETRAAVARTALAPAAVVRMAGGGYTLAAATFLCAVPDPAQARLAVAGAPRSPRGRRAPADLAVTRRWTERATILVARIPIVSGLPCYDRPDVGPHSRRSVRAARFAPPRRALPPSLGGRRGDRQLPRAADHITRHRGRSPPGRDRRGPPRHRQTASQG